MNNIKYLIYQFTSGNLNELNRNFDKLETDQKLLFFKALRRIWQVKTITIDSLDQKIANMTEEEIKERISFLKQKLRVTDIM